MIILSIIFSHFILSRAVQHPVSRHGKRNHTEANIIPAYRCSNAEIKFQFDYADLVKTSICDSHIPWRLAQLTYPFSSTFIDVGCNLGYQSALIFSLWSPSDGLSPRTLRESIVKDIAQKMNTNVENVDTVCSDGLIPQGQQSPLICLGHRGECNSRKPIRVIGFDGQKTHVETQRASIYRHFPHLKPSVILPADAGSDLLSGVQSSFEYEHAAVLDKIDFPGQTVTFSLRNDEGGHIVSPQQKDHIAGEAVPVTTIDEYCREKKIFVVDFIKIDAEGFDIKVIQGAAETLLHRRVKMVTFEGKGVSDSDWQRQFQVLDTQFGFDCYMNGENNVMVRLTECWSPDLLFNGTLPICDKSVPNHGCPDVGNGVQNRIDGNGYCVHRMRGRTLNALFDQMSLYKYAHGHVGDIVRDGKLAMPWARNEVSADGKVSLAANRNNIIDFERNFGRKFGEDFRRKWQ